MRVNPVPLLVVPGVALGGYAFGGVRGMVVWLSAWVAMVAAATVWAFVRHRRAKRDAVGT
jgi:hypothetical protein